jgi:hypothetical protein
MRAEDDAAETTLSDVGEELEELAPDSLGGVGGDAFEGTEEDVLAEEAAE